jgi:predicted GNAT family N-acyltransferase
MLKRVWCICKAPLLYFFICSYISIENVDSCKDCQHVCSEERFEQLTGKLRSEVMADVIEGKAVTGRVSLGGLHNG